MTTKSLFHLALFLAGSIFLYSCEKRTSRNNTLVDYTPYVDPFIGTGGHGHTYPGVSLPFGMVQLSPDNGIEGWDWSSGYHYSSNSIIGFSHTHLSGTGVGDMLDIRILPTNKTIIYSPNDSLPFDIKPHYASFSHEKEVAEPGYYSVVLDESNIQAELTASKRVGYHKYSFPDNKEAAILMDLGLALNMDSSVRNHIKIISDTLVTGFRHSTGWARDQKVYFAMRFSKKISSYDLFAYDTVYLNSQSTIESRYVTGVFKFDMNEEYVLQVKVGLSSVSEENALINLNNEILGWNFDQVRDDAKYSWNKELGKIKITSDNDDQKTIFYTALYHSMLAPNLFSDSLENTYAYRGSDNQVYTNKTLINYHTFSLWDTYRAEHPLFTVLHPEKVQNFIKALLSHYQETGLLPVWTLWANETNTMIGYHSIPAIFDAYHKGLLPDLDPDSLYTAMKSSAFQRIREIPLYLEYGYIPANTLSNTVSKTLEYAFDDWCIAQMAQALNDQDEYTYFMERSNFYKNVFDSSTLFMRAKLNDGTWKTPFDPIDTRYTNDYTEGNAWQYTWYVPHDIEGLIQMMGGAQFFEKKLDSLFSISSNIGSEAALDVSGMIGQYVHGNEPSHHIPYLYNYINKPDKTRSRIREIMNTLYKTGPEGLCGNEDCGQMSAWYVFNALGFYPVNPANSKYDIGIPLFEEAEIQISAEKSLIIRVLNYDPDNIKIGSIKLNEQTLTNPYITHKQVMDGGILEFEMVK